jgi:hypothetical protein
MSDINLDFTVSNNSIDFTVQPNDITITPTDVQLSIFAGGIAVPGGANQQVQYNKDGILAGDSGLTYDDITNQLSATKILTTDITATGNVAFGGYGGSNVNIQANTLSSANLIATTANIQNGTINANAITSVHSNLGNVSNVKIGGGVNGYVLQTDGTGNLNWAATGGGGGNGTPGGSNTQIQYNDNGVFGGNTGFTFNEVSGNVAIPGSLIVAGNISGNFIGNSLNANFANFAGNATNANVAVTAVSSQIANTVVDNFQPNITSLGTLTSLAVSSNITTSQLFATANITTPRLISNVATGTAPFVVASSTLVANLRVANATFADQAIDSSNATRAINVTGNSQPNITSLGTLSSVSVSGSATVGSLSTAGSVSATGNINGAFLNGSYANGTSNISIAPSGNITAYVTSSLSLTISSSRVTVPANFSVAGVSNLANINISGVVSATGNITGANLITAGLLTATGNVTGGNIKTVNGLIETTNGNIYANNGYIIGGEGVFSGLRFVNTIAANVTVQGIGASVATNKIPISINGTTYYILLST